MIKLFLLTLLILLAVRSNASSETFPLILSEFGEYRIQDSHKSIDYDRCLNKLLKDPTAMKLDQFDFEYLVDKRCEELNPHAQLPAYYLDV